MNKIGDTGDEKRKQGSRRQEASPLDENVNPGRYPPQPKA